jgi:hypothetical protein
MELVGHPPDPPDRERSSETRTVTPGYFSTLGLPVLAGRNFGTEDNYTSQPVVIVNEAWVKEFLTEKEDPLAQAFRRWDGHSIAIIGVVANARQNAVENARPEIDFPFSQFTAKEQQDAVSLSLNLFVRTVVPPLSIVPQLRKALHDIGPTVAFQTPETVDDVLDDALVTNRMESWLFGLFACIAVLLAAVGIHGLLVQETVNRIRDIGVRMALGSTRMGIARMMFTRIAVLLGIGLGAGVLMTFLLRRVFTSILVIQPQRDGSVIAALVALLALIGLLAALAPIRRAASIDPMKALRAE